MFEMNALSEILKKYPAREGHTAISGLIPFDEFVEARQQRGPQDRYTRQLETNVTKLERTRQQSGQNVVNLQKVYDSMSI